MTVGDVLDTLASNHDRRVVVRRAAAARPTVSAVVYDSRRAIAGSVFVALRGLKADGTEFVPQARGARRQR